MPDAHQASSRKYKVGIDLAPASLIGKAPGTAQLVANQARALFDLDVPWQWIPLVESQANPLWGEIQHLHPRIVPGRKISARAFWSVGREWAAAGCDLGFATAYFAPVSGPPVVTNFFDAHVFDHGEGWITSGRRANLHLNRVLMRHAISRSQRLFVLSNHEKNRLVQLFPRHGDKFIVNPCGLPAPAPAQVERPAWAAALSSKPFFLFVGAVSENKNQRRLLHAWGELQRRREQTPALVLAGPIVNNTSTADYFARNVRPLLEDLPCPEDIIFTDSVPAEQISWAYANADAYIQPSIAEGFALPVIEALARGLPVACSKTSSLPETAGDAALYFDPLDTQSIRAAVEILIDDLSVRARNQRLGPLRAAAFTWRRNAENVGAELEHVLSLQNTMT